METLETLDIATEFFNAFGIGVEVDDDDEEEEEEEEQDLFRVVDSSEAATAIEAALVDMLFWFGAIASRFG